MKPALVLLLQIVGVVLIAAAGFTVALPLGLAVSGAGFILFGLAWERE